LSASLRAWRAMASLTLDLMRRCDLDLQLHLSSHGGLCVCIGRLAQQTCLRLFLLSKRLHDEQHKSLEPDDIPVTEARTKGT
jgi:hypothetical protein